MNYPDELMEALKEADIDLSTMIYLEPTEGDYLIRMKGAWRVSKEYSFFFNCFSPKHGGESYTNNHSFLDFHLIVYPGIVLFWWETESQSKDYRMAVYYSPEQTIDEYIVYLRLLGC